MSSLQRPEPAFVLSLAGGILTLVGSLVVMMWAQAGMPFWGGAMGNMMGGYSGMMGGMTGGMGVAGTSFFAGMSILGAVAGILILAGAVLLYSRPDQASTWGLVILVFSIIGLFGMGGFLVGAVMGIVGGILALTLKPISSPSPASAVSK